MDGMGWYSTQNGILKIMMTYNDPLMKMTMTAIEMKASVTLVRHSIRDLTMTMMVGIIEKIMKAS